MKTSQWLLHPISIFSLSLFALISSLIIFIQSYLKVNRILLEIISKYRLNPKLLMEGETLVIIIVLSVLVAIIITGLIIIFIYYQKIIQLYYQQQNFINGFTHELKTPLASIQLYLETFQKFELNKKDFQHYVSNMLRDTQRLNENVGRILKLAQIEDKNYKAQFEYVDLVLVIQNFLANTPHLFDQGTIKFHNQVEKCLLMVDRGLFEMLLMNLITNGFRYNKKANHEKQVNIILASHKTKKNSFKLRVEDNGMGIEDRELKKIFKKFYQVGKVTKGSGLGLYFVQNICRLHHFKIEAKSNGKDLGSIFEISIQGDAL